MKSDPHLGRSKSPIREGVAVTLCGKKVENAKLLTLPPEVNDPRDYPNLCRLCRTISGEPGIEYEGVVVDGKYLDPKPPKPVKGIPLSAA